MPSIPLVIGRDAQQEQEIREYFLHKPVDCFASFDLLLQFIERCIEDGKDAALFRNAATYIACGCSVDGKSNAPTATGGRGMPSIDRFNPFSI